MKLTVMEQVKVRSRLVKTKTSDLLCIILERHIPNELRYELMYGVRVNDSQDVYGDKWHDVVILASEELDKRVPNR